MALSFGNWGEITLSYHDPRGVDEAPDGSISFRKADPTAFTGATLCGLFAMSSEWRRASEHFVCGGVAGMARSTQKTCGVFFCFKGHFKYSG